MITRARMRVILDLAYPVTIGLCSSFFMAMVDLAMVGRIGTPAIAAVGLAGFSYTLLAAFMTGLTPAVQASVSRRIGEGSTEPRCVPLNAGLMLALVLGIPLSLLCYWLAPRFFALISADPAVTKEGLPYLRALLIGLAASGMDNAFQGHWAGVGRTKVYMLNILFCNLLHVGLNYVLIFGHFGFAPMSAAGAGVATSVAVYVSTAIYLLVTSIAFRHDGFLTAKPTMDNIVRMLQIGIPAMMETTFFSLGFLVYYWIVGRMGTPELAVSNVLVRLSVITDLFGQALGLAAITLVQRTLGEGDADAAERWGWDIAKIGVVWITFLGLPIVLFPHYVLSIFLVEPGTLEMAILPAQLTAACLGIASLIMIFATTLISLGDGKRVLLVSFSAQWLVYLPAVWIVGVKMHGTLLGITYVQLVYGSLATTMIVALWAGGRWKTLTV